MGSNTDFQSDHHPYRELKRIVEKIGVNLEDRAFALYMDQEDPLSHLRKEFAYPKMKMLKGVDLSIVDPEEDCVYFCGNSLGLCPKKTKEYMNIEVEKWEQTAVQGHTNGDLPWAWCDELLDGDMAKIVGATKEEVCLMNGLTVNLHLLLISFYRPTPERYKIMLEGKAFPSDYYAFESQILLHGYNPKESMVLLQPREGEDLLRTEDILAKIEEEGDSIAVICFSGVQYYTGQLFEIDKITKAGQAKGCYVGWDLAHAVGNAELNLHDWGVDFACWCTYKYLNSGAGCLAGCFFHEKHFHSDLPQLRGWWGHKMDTRFRMENKWEPYVGAYSYRISNTPGFLCPSLKASLEIFKKTSMSALRKKSNLLTAYLEALINQKYGRHKTDGDNNSHVCVKILTPTDPNQRGAQLSLSFSVNITRVFAELQKRGVMCDERKPSVIRVAPVPLYCSFEDVHRFMKYLDEALQAANK
ncbi:hypothetical protein CHS0354_025698 [Potamilus streckersoni]|uniref:Kynureninase n=1 Tax=Potamilus streckersoni TaxID=2493646 RepID=A0AAE0S0U5_9BIVA|nr:hypothetical protein CHS0354_025698 [Potamilus streckersoni]